MNAPSKPFFIKAEWDSEASVWYVAETDIPGLVTEAATLEELAENVRRLVPVMVDLNAHCLDRSLDGGIPIELVAHQEMKICA